MEKVSELTDQEVCLAIAKHEHPYNHWKMLGGFAYDSDMGGSYTFELNWQTIMPIWEREAVDYANYQYDLQGHQEGLANEVIAEIFTTWCEPQYIARALLSMWYPQQFISIYP